MSARPTRDIPVGNPLGNPLGVPLGIAFGGIDLLTGNAVTGKLELAAGDVAVIGEEGG
jgi:hypothetical protein